MLSGRVFCPIELEKQNVVEVAGVEPAILCVAHISFTIKLHPHYVVTPIQPEFCLKMNDMAESAGFEPAKEFLPPCRILSSVP